MPLAPEEVLEKLTQATEEAKGAVRDLHGAASAGLDVVKRQRQGIRNAVEAEVSSVVDEISEEARKFLMGEVHKIADELRERLGLPTS